MLDEKEWTQHSCWYHAGNQTESSGILQDMLNRFHNSDKVVDSRISVRPSPSYQLVQRLSITSPKWFSFLFVVSFSCNAVQPLRLMFVWANQGFGSTSLEIRWKMMARTWILDWVMACQLPEYRVQCCQNSLGKSSAISETKQQITRVEAWCTWFLQDKRNKGNFCGTEIHKWKFPKMRTPPKSKITPS